MSRVNTFKTEMSSQSPICNRPFCFKYCINLGDNKFGSLTVNERTNLYEEAEKFCLLHNLDSSIAAILENEMFEEVLKVQGEYFSSSKSTEKKIKNKVNDLIIKEEKSREKDIKDKKEERRSRKKNKLQVSELIFENYEKEATKLQALNHWEEMFRRHEEIENRKEMSRKASIEKIPFRPNINNLSRKIVDRKRSENGRGNTDGDEEQKILVKGEIDDERNRKENIEFGYGRKDLNKKSYKTKFY